MRLTADAKATKLELPSGATLVVGPDGVTVPKDLESEVRAALRFNDQIREAVEEAKPKEAQAGSEEKAKKVKPEVPNG